MKAMPLTLLTSPPPPLSWLCYLPPLRGSLKGLSPAQRVRQHSPSDRAEKLLSDSNTMFGSVLLCYWSFSLLHLSSSLVHGNIQLDDDRRTDTSYLSDIGQ
ncbi:unnamed protein product [Pleuronectes platessa]|uniref:Uncharacterized protein n=1 Tax=Pleuronectes platessa TaxID=8262 RepID=A0A9N7U5P8_PLEPL|nr:unnamed protein product [Pleuronectes platessa]